MNCYKTSHKTAFQLRLRYEILREVNLAIFTFVFREMLLLRNLCCVQNFTDKFALVKYAINKLFWIPSWPATCHGDLDTELVPQPSCWCISGTRCATWDRDSVNYYCIWIRILIKVASPIIDPCRQQGRGFNYGFDSTPRLPIWKWTSLPIRILCRIRNFDPDFDPTLAARLDKDLDLNKLTTCTVKKYSLYSNM